MRLLAVLLTAVLVLTGCGDDDEPVATGGSSTTAAPATVPAEGDEQARLDAARQIWDAAGIEDYEMSWRKLCFCPTISYVDTIEDGEVVDHQPAEDHDGVEDPGAKTMDDVFDEIQEAIDSDPHELTTEYDPDTGAVQSYFVDVVENMADEEYGLEVTLRTAAPAT